MSTTTYYVSTTGSDTNDGLAAVTGGGHGPWLTFGKAAASVGAGSSDIIYFAPGTYRLTAPAGVTEGTLKKSGAGTGASCIRWIADPDTRIFTAEKPGYVRITRCDANDAWQTGHVIDFNGITNNSFDGFWIDGNTNNYAVNGTSTATSFLLNCYLHGRNGAQVCTCTNCLIIGAGDSYAYRNCVPTNCISIGAEEGYFGGTCVNCISICGLRGFYQANARNCFAIAGTQVGFRGTSVNAALVNCHAMLCSTGYMGDDAGNPLDVSTSYVTGCGTTQDAECSGTATAGAQVLFDARALLRILQPILATGLVNLGTATSLPATDILNRTRAGTADIGPWDLNQTRQGWGIPVRR